jgi:hypothetical protein
MKSISVFAIAAVAAGSFACAEPEEPTLTSQEQEVLGETVAQPIVNGTPATAYTEAALVNGPGFICSGAVIAPRIVLTAGHCISAGTYTIVAPYAGNQSSKASKTWTDYTSSGEYVNPNTLDVGVIILDKAITLSAYPALTSAPSPAGTKLLNVGRIRNGQASYTGLFAGTPVTIKSGSWGFPKAYVTEELIESGDSGGPVYLSAAATRTITAVNSGGGGGTQVLARVDLAYAKIQQLIAANGGSGGTAPTPTPTPTPPPAPGCSGTAEAEPNDTSKTGNPLAGTRCGSLASASDVDWYTWSVDKAGVAYDVSLTTSGDANLLMWKWTGTAWSQITGASATKIAATSSGGGNYVVAVRGGAAQSYALKLTK